MSLEIKFIKAIEKVLSDFEKSETNISTKNAKDITHIRGLLDENESFVVIQALVTDYVNNEMSRKLFGFLPFINDLKSLLIDVLKREEFNPIGWLREVRSRRNSSSGSLTNLSEIVLDIENTEHQVCESGFSNLEKDIKQIKQNNDLLIAKNTQLEKAVDVISKDYTQIKAELDKVKTLLTAAQTEIDRLNLIILQKDEVIAQLSTENEKLKNHLYTSPPDKPITSSKKNIVGMYN